jgi:thiamine-phosphate pyrophosphorylase
MNETINWKNMDDQNLNGVYLVVDPAMEQSVLLDRVEQALEGGVSILQIWNHWSDDMQVGDKQQLASYIREMALDYEVPVLMNDDWEMMVKANLDGVHFDAVPDNFAEIKKEVGRDFLAGLTCGNDLEVIEWAENNDVDYVSFCAMFPSPSVGSCEIVKPETVQKAREITDMPMFLSGGITPDKIAELDELEFNGVAVISGILKDDEPRKKVSNYQKALQK